MSRRVTAIFGVLGVAAFSVWLKKKRARLTQSDTSQVDILDAVALPAATGGQGLMRVDIDDDEAAEIIKRAKPALERAAEL